MKTAPMMVLILPRFRWLLFGFTFATGLFESVDGSFSPVLLLFLVLAVCTYPVEWANRRLLDLQAEIKSANANTQPGDTL